MSGLLGDGNDEPDDESDDDGDLMGGADDGLMGDDMMFDDDGDDGDDGDVEGELTYRLDEVEKEIESLGNKVETVRGENEQISESITTVERNVDKLVEMYEIVTQGINPFVGDQELGNAFESAAEQGGGFGADPGDEIDDDIVNSDAETLLDDDEFEEADDALDDEFEEADDALDDEFEEADDALDDEFEADDADLDDGIDAVPDEPDDNAEFEEELAVEEEPIVDDLDTEDDLEADDGETDTVDAGEDGDEDAAVDHDRSEKRDAASDDSTATALENAVNGEIGDPPYLVRHPSRNDAEVATLEWMRFLVDTAGVDGAAQTIAYYESVGWVSDAVETYLQSLLNGFRDETEPPAETSAAADDGGPDPRSVLSTSEHKRSLQYIAWIATPEKEPSLLRDDDESDDGAAPNR
ncbi:FlaD/FlaE family flagellar protein [Halopiger djelfimassiliensis]|uniref:FlaD/FlaE family flagellar protein n=1 Tax=Halopiger djelfimassiliensis TaxID=1293047 RepID=UPI00067768D6|nr:FlaD/FlaE family flagellar protein [Halopiger djelfimassiliensis]